MKLMCVAKNAVKNLLVLGVTFCLTACIHIGSSQDSVSQNYYTLSYAAVLPIHPAYTDKVVIVNIGSVLSPVHGTGLIYQQKDFQLKKYALHHWLAPPATMIAPIIATQLNNTDAFKAVVNAPTYAGISDYQISLVLQKLQQNFLSAKESKEELALQLILINLKTNKVIAAKTFQTTVDAAPNAPGGVMAANQALAQLMPDMIQFIVNHLH